MARHAIASGKLDMVGTRAIADPHIGRLSAEVASRNVHAAIYDALRVAKDL